MTSVRTKFTVGMFVIIGLSLILAVVMWLGMSDLFKETRTYAAFFDESVQGLSQDSAVKYRGVNVGRVENIGVAPDGRLVRIVFTIEDTLENPQSLIASLKSVGITGLMFIELERTPPGELPERPELGFETEYPVIVTRPSEIQQVLTDIYDLVSQLKKIDIVGISNQMESVLTNIDQTISNAEIDTISDGLQKIIERSNTALQSEKWNEMYDSFENTTGNLNQLIDQTDRTVAGIHELLGKSAEDLRNSTKLIEAAAQDTVNLIDLAVNIVAESDNRLDQYDQQVGPILENLQEATIGLNRLVDRLQNQPSQLFFGSPPQEKPIER